MATTEKIWSTKGIYHSYLTNRQREEDGALVCQIMSEPRDSKYGGRIIMVRPHGYDEDDGHWLTLEEGSSVETDIAGAPKKTWLLLEAAGSGASATIKRDVATDQPDTIEIVEDHTIELVKDAQPTNGATKATNTITGRPVSNEFLDSLLRAHDIVKEFKTITGEELTENVRTLATNLRASKDGGW